MLAHLITLLCQVTIAQTTLAEDAFIYSFAPAEFYKFKARLLVKFQNVTNDIAIHTPLIPQPENKEVVVFNVDTLYSAGMLNLEESPRLLTVPPLDRYATISGIDAFSDYQLAVTNSEIPNGEKYLFYGPSTTDQEATQLAVINNAKPVKFATKEAIVLLRILYQNKTIDLNNAVDLTLKFKVDRVLPGTDTPQQAILAKMVDEMKSVGLSLPDIKLLPTDYAVNPQKAWAFAKLGLDSYEPPTEFSKNYVKTFTPLNLQQYRLGVVPGVLESSVVPALKRITDKEMVAGKKYPGEWVTWELDGKIANFGEDYLLRAAFGYSIFLGNPQKVAYYYKAFFDTNKESLNGSKNYTIHFDANGLPPVDGFWSVTAYFGIGHPSEGYLIPNELERYNIGDRTEGAQFNQDGSFTIYIGANKPGDASKVANWLPVSGNSTFQLLLRLYSPKPSVAFFSPPLIQVSN